MPTGYLVVSAGEPHLTNNQSEEYVRHALPFIYEKMRAKISSIYNMGGFKTVSAVAGGNLAVFSSMHMIAIISLYHQESVQCQVNLFLAAFYMKLGAHTLVHLSIVYLCFSSFNWLFVIEPFHMQNKNYN